MKKVIIVVAAIAIFVLSGLFFYLKNDKQPSHLYVIAHDQHLIVDEYVAIKTPIFITNQNDLRKLLDASGFLNSGYNRIYIDEFDVVRTNDEVFGDVVYYGYDLIFYFEQLIGTIEFKNVFLDLYIGADIISIKLGDIFLTSDITTNKFFDLSSLSGKKNDEYQLSTITLKGKSTEEIIEVYVGNQLADFQRLDNGYEIKVKTNSQNYFNNPFIMLVSENSYQCIYQFEYFTSLNLLQCKNVQMFRI